MTKTSIPSAIAGTHLPTMRPEPQDAGPRMELRQHLSVTVELADRDA